MLHSRRFFTVLIAFAFLFAASCSKKKEKEDVAPTATEAKIPEKAEAPKKVEASKSPELGKPSWILGDASEEAVCEVAATGLRCVGIASGDSKDTAGLLAVGLALDEAAIITARAVQAEAEGKPWTPDDQSDISDDAQLKARKSIDSVLGISPSVPPRHDNLYYERFEDSPLFKVYVEMSIGTEDRKRIAESLLSPDQD